MQDQLPKFALANKMDATLEGLLKRMLCWLCCEDDVIVTHASMQIMTIYRVATSLALTTSGQHRLHSGRVFQR